MNSSIDFLKISSPSENLEEVIFVKVFEESLPLIKFLGYSYLKSK
jgi:hypothetical protein